MRSAPLGGGLRGLGKVGDVVAPAGNARAKLVGAPMTEGDARELFQLVGALEGGAARGAAKASDEKRKALVAELTGGHPERIRICDNDSCRWIFYDTSRTGRRRWCDMATCGNRAKAARHPAKISPKH